MSNYKMGYTLIETILVIAIVFILGGITITLSIESINDYNLSLSNCYYEDKFDNALLNLESLCTSAGIEYIEANKELNDVYSENPDCNFRPSPGTIQALHLPGGMGVRIDSAIYQGYTIPPYYDSMIAKLIVHAPTRKEAIQKMRWALSEFLVDGVETNIDFQLRLLKTEAFEQGTYDNAFLMHWLEDSKHKQS